MTYYRIFSILLLFISLCSGCKSQTLPLSCETRYGTFKFTKRDKAVIDDLIKTCDNYLYKISYDLELDINKNTIIEIYPSQAAYDDFIINPALKGSPAISGNGIIQLVSPKAKINKNSISYTDRLLFVIHEYVHLMVDQLETPPPIFLDEGLACYYGSYDFYNSIIKEHFGEIKTFPSIEKLQNQYYEIPAADLFSFMIID